MLGFGSPSWESQTTLEPVKHTRPWLYYSILRVALFVVIFIVLMLLSVNPWLATTAAAVVALCLSVYLPQGTPGCCRPRHLRAAPRRTRRPRRDNDIENEILDRSEQHD